MSFLGIPLTIYGYVFTMDWWLFTFFTGAILSLFLPVTPALFYVAIFISLAVGLIFIKPLRTSSGFLFGCAWMLFQGVIYQNSFNINNLDRNILHTTSHVVTGKVQNLVSEKNGFYRFNLKIEKLDYLPLKQPFTIRLRWEKPTFAINQDNRVQLKVKIKPAHGLANLGGFSYQTWLRQQKIIATGYVLKDKENVNLSAETSFRQQQFEHLKISLPEHPLSSLILALSLGERSQITTEQWQVLKATGTQHLVAISGLHLGLVASSSFIFMLLLIKFLPLSWLNKTRLPVYLAQYNIRYIAVLISLLLALLYANLAGFAIPTVRALFMLSLYWLSRVLKLKFTVRRWLLLVLFFIVLLEKNGADRH